jgi:hypothetical protein
LWIFSFPLPVSSQYNEPGKRKSLTCLESPRNETGEKVLLISGTTVFGCIGYLGYDFVRSRRKKVKNEKQINKGR